MKKTILLLAVILMIGGNAGAQKKNVSKANTKLLSDTPDLNAAKDAILLALQDSTTNKLANTWFVAGNVFKAIFDDQLKQQLTKKGDKTVMAEALDRCFIYYSEADSLDQLPDKKGNIKPKFRQKIVEKVKGFQRGFTDVGSFYYDKKDYKNALKMFNRYLEYKSLPYLSGLGYEKDTLIPLITYYCGLSATQAEMPEVAIKYYEAIKDSMSAKDSRWIYSRLSEDYATLKDTANMVRIYQLGAQKFPTEPFYMRSLINYYINEKHMVEALKWVDEDIKQDTISSVLWNIRGRIVENDGKIDEAKACYQKAIDLDPKFADAYGNIGRIYYNYAVGELNRINSIRNDKLYKIEKAKVKVLFEKPRPYFEKANSISPDDRDFLIALRGIYYNLGMDAKYTQMDQRLKELTGKE
jgi:tetratricopeptide (TPR) repeat protein